MSEQMGVLPFGNTIRQAPADNLGDMQVYNASGEEIPAYAPMLLDDSTTGIYRDVIKPNAADLDACKIVFNGPSPIPIGRTGVAVSGYEVLSTINGTPALGDDIGTVSGQWYLSTGQTGFKARVVMGGLCYVVPFEQTVTPPSIDYSTILTGADIDVTGIGNGTTSYQLYYGAWRSITPTDISSDLGLTSDTQLQSLFTISQSSKKNRTLTTIVDNGSGSGTCIYDVFIEFRNSNLDVISPEIWQSVPGITAFLGTKLFITDQSYSLVECSFSNTFKFYNTGVIDSIRLVANGFDETSSDFAFTLHNSYLSIFNNSDVT